MSEFQFYRKQAFSNKSDFILSYNWWMELYTLKYINLKIILHVLNYTVINKWASYAINEACGI